MNLASAHASSSHLHVLQNYPVLYAQPFQPILFRRQASPLPMIAVVSIAGMHTMRMFVS